MTTDDASILAPTSLNPGNEQSDVVRPERRGAANPACDHTRRDCFRCGRSLHPRLRHRFQRCQRSTEVALHDVDCGFGSMFVWRIVRHGLGANTTGH